MDKPMDRTEARALLPCKFTEIDAIFGECLERAEAVMSPAGIAAWLAGATRICKLYRGIEPVLDYLTGMPAVVRATDESIIAETAEMAAWFADIPYGPAIRPFLANLPAVAQRLEGAEPLRQWFHLVRRVTAEGRNGLVALLATAPRVLALVTMGGLVEWVSFGLNAYRTQHHRLPEYFSLSTADAHAVLQRQRHGTLLVDHHRTLSASLRAMWGLDLPLRALSLAFDHDRQPMPHMDKLGLHLPDVLDDRDGVAALDIYRATLAHLAGHRLWSRPMIADNFSQFQHLAIEVIEDSRIEALAMRRFPGLRRLFLALHPSPAEDACPSGWSPLRHRMTLLSRALLDADHPYDDPVICALAARFRDADMTDPTLATRLGVEALVRLHHPDFHLAKVWFTDTRIPYRDDNRWLWQFLEDTDSADDFHSDHNTPDMDESDSDTLLPSLYPEWDYTQRSYRPDWATVWQVTQAPGDAGFIDELFHRHRNIAKQIHRIIDRLKPQNRRRIRHQRDGEDLDLDLVIRAMIDVQSGRQPDDRVYQSHIPDNRDVAVLLLLDLSQSIGRCPDGSDVSLLHLQQEAATLLAWAVDLLGDAFAIAGFSSETRHQVRLSLVKDFPDSWGEETKARLAGIRAGANTRMGAALRHAGALISPRPEQKKLILLLSDGEPHDVDVDDPDHLKWDTHMAVAELKATGITTFCVTLDTRADDYIADIFGPAGYAVIDRIARLPDTMTRMFLSLTG
jgi:nitric oxide reductase NorD protein